MKASHRWVLASLGLMFSWPLESRTANATGGVRTVALSGMRAPGTSETFGDVGYSGVSLNNHGETAFIASPSFNSYEFIFEPLATSPINDESVWTEAGGHGLRRMAQEGLGVPGGGTFAHLARALISDLGHTIYQESFSGNPNSRHFPTRIVRNQLGQGDFVVAAQGSIAPSTTHPYFAIDPPLVNARGEVAFFGVVFSSPIRDFQGIWAELHGGALDLIARTGDSAPGTSGTFHDLSDTLIP